MKTASAWAWLTAGVMALGLNGIYQDGGTAWAPSTLNSAVARIDNRAVAVLALATGRADWFMAKAEPVTAREENAACRFATVVTRVQTRMLRRHSAEKFAEMSARQEAAFARLEANRARIESQVARVRIEPVDFNTPEIPEVACPRTTVKVPYISVPQVNIPAMKVPHLRIPAPVVHGDAAGNGTV